MTEILVLGVLVAIIFYELTDITPGGIIVPGLMVAYINQPLRMIYTVVVAIVAFLLVKLFSRRFLIFGERRFVLLILVSLILNVLVNLFLGLFMDNLTLASLSIVGYTVAGIMANNMYKQGVVRTVSSLAITVGVIELLVILFMTWGITL